MEFMLKTFLNRTVQVHPGDTDPKFGIVRDMNPHGVVFEATNWWGRHGGCDKGSLKFIAWEKLTFVLAE